jgi:hypothetical protein
MALGQDAMNAGKEVELLTRKSEMSPPFAPTDGMRGACESPGYGLGNRGNHKSRRYLARVNTSRIF